MEYKLTLEEIRKIRFKSSKKSFFRLWEANRDKNKSSNITLFDTENQREIYEVKVGFFKKLIDSNSVINYFDARSGECISLQENFF